MPEEERTSPPPPLPERPATFQELVALAAKLEALVLFVQAAMHTEKAMPGGGAKVATTIARARQIVSKVEGHSSTFRQIGADKTRTALEKLIKGITEKPP